MRRTYLDHAASAPLRPEARDAMVSAFEVVGNPASLHTSGRRARSVLEDAREDLAEVLDADPSEVVFTSGGTEADNIAVHGGWAGRRAVRPGIVVSSIEHAAVRETAAALSLRGARLTEWPVGADGVVIPEWLADTCDETTGVCSLMWVNNETGVIQPIGEMAEHARSVGAWSHSDAVQAFGHVPVSFHDSGLDMMTVSAHKVGGPVGIGALVVRRECGVGPVQFGGSQERLRSGTQLVALAAGFAAVARHAARADLDAESLRLRRLRERVVAAATDEEGVDVLGEKAETSPAIVNLRITGARADDVLMLLDAAGIDCSTGSACEAGLSQPSHVAAAMGIGPGASETVRFSFGWSTTDADVTRLLEVFSDVVARARRASG